MAHKILELVGDRIVSGLRRRAITTPSQWACNYRIMGQPYPGKWTFKYHPWLKGMHDSDSDINIGQKGAQVGYTENVLNITFFNMDVKNVDCLYVLPASKPDATDFSSGRFDPALELSSHLENMFSDVKNVGHKRAGSCNLYIRGSKSRAGLKSIPVGFCVLDEVDEMNQANIPLALERLSGQRESMVWMLSTPTYPGEGINRYYLDSTQNHFHFKCPKCTRWTELLFPDCLQICGEDVTDPRISESYIRCKECQKKLEHELKYEFLADGKWIESFSNRVNNGWHVNQMYSSTVTPGSIAKSYFLAQKNPSDETEFYNSKLGLPHAVKGSKITDADINARIQAFRNGQTKPRNIITMGVDVGKWLHVEIDEWTLFGSRGVDFNAEAKCKVINIEKCEHFTDLDRLMSFWGVHACVVDAHPEKRLALQFANRFYGLVRLCIYAQGINGKEIHPSKDEEQMVLVDRTSWLDLSLGRFRREEMIDLPIDLPKEYREHLKVPARLYKKDKEGNPIGYYESFDNEDHYAHSRNYAEIALKFAATMKQNVNIPSPI